MTQNLTPENLISKATFFASSALGNPGLPPAPRTYIHRMFESWLKANRLRTSRDFNLDQFAETLRAYLPVRVLRRGQEVTSVFSISERASYETSWTWSSCLILNRVSGTPVKAWLGHCTRDGQSFIAEVPGLTARLREGKNEGLGSIWTEVTSFPPTALASPEGCLRHLQVHHEPVHQLLRKSVLYQGRSRRELTKQFVSSLGKAVHEEYLEAVKAVIPLDLPREETLLSQLSLKELEVFASTAGPSVNQARNRWIETFPAFVPALSDPACLELVSQGGRFSNWYAEKTGTTTGAVKRLRAFDLPSLSKARGPLLNKMFLAEGLSASQLHWLLGDVPESKLPAKGSQDARAMLDLVEVTLQVSGAQRKVSLDRPLEEKQTLQAEFLKLKGPGIIRQLLRSTHGDWNERLETLGPSEKECWQYVQRFRDFIKPFAERLIAGGMALEGRSADDFHDQDRYYQAVLLSWLSLYMDAPRLIKASELWHKVLGAGRGGKAVIENFEWNKLCAS